VPALLNKGDHYVNRFFLVYAVASLALVGCGKGADSNTREADRPKAADTIPPVQTEAKPADPRVEPATSGDVTGSYTALGTLPAPFAELDHLLLANIDENAKPAPLNGFLRPKDMKKQDYKLVDPKLDGKKLTFTTIAVDGVSYRFDGAFEKLDSFAVNPPPQDVSILGGTLSRLKEGKVEAETPVNFAYTPGG
jgi:hypothetical protein